MRVLHVVPSLSESDGGPSTALSSIASGLAGAGVEVDVVTTTARGPDRATPEPSAQDSVNVRQFHRQTSFYKFSWPLTRWLATYVARYDIVHVHALFSYASLPAAYYAHRRGVPYVVRPLGTLNRWGFEHRHRALKKLSFRLIERRILAHAAAIHFTSTAEMEEAARLGIGSRQTVIPIGIDTTRYLQAGTCPFFEAYPDLVGRPIVLFLSRLDGKKGLDLLVPAFASIAARHPEAVLAIAGSGDPALQDVLRAEIERLHIKERVHWLGFLTGDIKRGALAAASLFVLPSYSENFGVAAVEAMAAGVPVVLSDQVALASEAADAGAGLIVQCRVEPLGAAIDQLLSDPERGKHMGSAGQSLAASRFSIEQSTRALMDLYHEIAR